MHMEMIVILICMFFMQFHIPYSVSKREKLFINLKNIGRKGTTYSFLYRSLAVSTPETAIPPPPLPTL